MMVVDHRCEEGSAAAVDGVGRVVGPIQPLLPVVPRRADHPWRKRLDGRKVMCGILFVLCAGISWEFLPQELGFGSGMTCWRRLWDWNDAGS
jgi:transposase